MRICEVRDLCHAVRCLACMRVAPVAKEDFQYGATSSAFRWEDALARFLRPSRPRTQWLQGALVALWGLVLVAVVWLILSW